MQELERHNQQVAEDRSAIATRLGLNAIPRDPVSHDYLPRDDIEQGKIDEYLELTQDMELRQMPTHRYGESALIWQPFVWPGRADDRTLYTESTQQALQIQGLLKEVSVSEQVP